MLSTSVEALRKLKTPIVECRNCNQQMVIPKRKEKCGTCKNDLQYYEFNLNPKNPIVKCSTCTTPNKVPFNKYTFKMPNAEQKENTMKFECPHCDKMAPLKKEVLKKYAGKIIPITCPRPTCKKVVKVNIPAKKEEAIDVEATFVSTKKKSNGAPQKSKGHDRS